MLTYELNADQGVLIVEVTGPLSEADFSELTAAADHYIEAKGRLSGLMICAEKFPGWENLGGMIAHFRFVRDHHTKIRKVAFVSNSELVALLPKIGRHFVSADVRHFDADEKNAALEWLNG